MIFTCEEKADAREHKRLAGLSGTSNSSNCQAYHYDAETYMSVCMTHSLPHKPHKFPPHSTH